MLSKKLSGRDLTHGAKRATTPVASADERLAALEAAFHKLDKEKEAKEQKETDTWSTVVKACRYTVLVTLMAVSAYYTVQLSLEWARYGSQSGSQLSLEEAEHIEMPTAGMIPAPYATDANCFYPTFGTCTAYFASLATGGQQTLNCASWLANTTAGLRNNGQAQVIWSLDGTLATKSGFTFTSILDYVEYTFEFSTACTEPYLWVYVTADQRVVTEANLDPAKSMADFAQSSFLVQGGQYVMVAFNVQQEIDLDGTVANTTVLSASSMQVDRFPAHQNNARMPRIATVVFRPGSLKILTNVEQPGQSLIELISIIGGWIGMFLGLSFISLIDFIDAVYRAWEERRESSVRKVGVIQAVRVVGAMRAAGRVANGSFPTQVYAAMDDKNLRADTDDEGKAMLEMASGSTPSVIAFATTTA